jgi:lipopolysaccharide export system protein LptA
MLRPLVLNLALLLPGLALAQTNLSLGDIATNADTPVEVTADSLAVDQDTGRAVFSGNVIVVQGDIRIGAGKVEVLYDAEGGAITRLVASDGITFATATEAAEASEADYDLATGLLILTGQVLLTQGKNALAAERMTVNLRDGSAQLDGRVRTVFVPEGQ